MQWNSFHYQGSLKSLKPHWDSFDKCAGKWQRIKTNYRHSIKMFMDRERLFNQLIILTHTVCFRGCVFSKRLLIITGCCFGWAAVYISISPSLCLLFRKLQKDSTLFWCTMKASYKIRKWDFCFPGSLRAQESIHCKLYYVS